ncbi:DUF5916 domain-containing protein [Deltaproteobacteria bacterium]|nr:DUF5916 domain-containing protein [Deltaproteobacteria bacterium]
MLILFELFSVILNIVKVKMSEFSYLGSSLRLPGTAMIISLFLAVWLLAPRAGFAAINVDGRLDESEWTGAQSFSDFLVIDPLTLSTPRLPTEVRILSASDGLAVAFICEQPPEETRTRTITMRDAGNFYSDSVSLMIDFDGTHEIAYEFSVSITGSYRDSIITNEINFSNDWDGLWQRAVNEEPQRWTVEILLPWSIVAMREGDGDTRQIGVSFQRVLNSRNEKSAYPEASTARITFISDFAKIEVEQYSAQEFDIWPYVTVLSDLVNDSVKGKAGVDLFWKPSGRFQLAGTINPDFGQVESDDLVINFTAIETFYSDKRPFFTENQGLFKTSMPMGSQVLHTRRIGGQSDDRSGPSNIDGALKIIGSAGPFDYGILAAQEADDAGRSFFAGRLNFPTENLSLGLLTTYTERPFLDRRALVNSIDYEFRHERIYMRGQFVASGIDAVTEDNSGYGAFTMVEYVLSDQWRYRVVYTRLNDTLDLNDMGYLRRNNLGEAYAMVEWRQTALPEDSRAATVAWSAKTTDTRTTEGIRLPGTFTFNRTEKMKSGSETWIDLGVEFSGYDDLISRGNGLVYLNERWHGTFSYSTQRRGMWRKSLALKVFQEGYDDWGVGLEGNVSLYPHEKVTVDFRLNPRWSRDWLMWIKDDQLASFSRRQVSSDIATTWFPAERHEIRLRAQWLVINADAGQAFRIGSGARLIPSNDTINSFAAMNFGLQLRYRYEIGPLSDFYFVYSRGGLDYIDNPDKSTLGLFGTSTSLDNSDQILVKLRYRF